MDFKSELIDKFNLIKVDIRGTVKAGRSYMSISSQTNNVYTTFFTPENDYFPSFSENTDLYVFPVDTSDLNPGSVVKDIAGDILVLFSDEYDYRFYAEVTNIENTWSEGTLSIVEVLYRA